MIPNSRNVSLFGRTNLREPHRIFGIKQNDRLSHFYIIGKTGTGKTTLLETLIRQDVVARRGFALIDPHGDLVERVASRIPRHRQSDTIYFNVPDATQRLGYNPLLRVSQALRPLVASGLIDVFKKMWADAWGVRMEHILRNALLALLDQPAATIADILPMLTSKAFRAGVLARVENEQVKTFWLREYAGYSPRYQADGIAPIQNKVGAFLSDPRLRRILVPEDAGLRLRQIMDSGKVLLVNLAQGKLGADSSSLLGGLLVTSLGSAAFSRSDVPAAARPPFFLYVDEFQNFTTLALANMLAELRKFGVGVVLAHQYLQQIDPPISHAVLGNVGTLIAFRVGAYDAGLLAQEFEPVFERRDFLSLPNYDVLLRLMIDGAPSRPFSATTLPPVF